MANTGAKARICGHKFRDRAFQIVLGMDEVRHEDRTEDRRQRTADKDHLGFVTVCASAPYSSSVRCPLMSVFRFAPSPNGYLHLGHALSALMNFDLASAAGGRLLLRIEDIDSARCRPEFETAIYEDLAWLGIAWERPVRRQSEHLDDYRGRAETAGRCWA